MIDLVEQKDMLKEAFREVILEVMHEERLNFYDSIFPKVSKNENAEIIENYGTPANYRTDDFVDMTDWVFDENKIS
jgi:hypothetical protein